MSINSGSYITGTATVQSGDTISLQVTSSPFAGATIGAILTITDVTDTYSVTTTAGSPPPGGGGLEP